MCFFFLFPESDIFSCMSYNVLFLSIKYRILKWPCLFFVSQVDVPLLIKHPGVPRRLCPSLAMAWVGDIGRSNLKHTWKFKSGGEIKARNWFAQLLGPICVLGMP